MKLSGVKRHESIIYLRLSYRTFLLMWFTTRRLICSKRFKVVDLPKPLFQLNLILNPNSLPKMMLIISNTQQQSNRLTLKLITPFKICAIVVTTLSSSTHFAQASLPTKKQLYLQQGWSLLNPLVAQEDASWKKGRNHLTKYALVSCLYKGTLPVSLRKSNMGTIGNPTIQWFPLRTLDTVSGFLSTCKQMKKDKWIWTHEPSSMNIGWRP